MSLVTVVIPGKPVVWKRAQSNGSRRFSDPKTVIAKNFIRLKTATTPGIDIWECPVRVQLDFFFALKGGRGFKATRPDLDNLAKLVLDALNGIAYVDDGQVVDLRAMKHQTGPARTVLKIGPV